MSMQPGVRREREGERERGGGGEGERERKREREGGREGGRTLVHSSAL